jgi:hypothetical protein
MVESEFQNIDEWLDKLDKKVEQSNKVIEDIEAELDECDSFETESPLLNKVISKQEEEEEE